MKNKVFYFVFVCLFAANLQIFAEKSSQDWKLIGVSGNSYQIELLLTDENEYFVPSYQVLKHLNITRNEKNDTIIAKFNKNELKFIRNSDKYLFNDTQKSLNRATIYEKRVNYCDIVSFCAAMNLLTGLFFDYDTKTQEIRVGKTKSDAIPDDSIRGVIVIDPGHGGRDPGAIGFNGTNEKDVVLSIAKEVKKYLDKYKNIEVLLTRDEDIFIPLSDRVKFANEKNADLFISVHTNAAQNKNQTVGGYKMYFLSDARNESDERTAMFENSVVAMENKPETDGITALLSSLAGNEYLKESQDVSIMLEKSFSNKVADIEKLHTGVGQANFFVLNGALMPAVLVETAFISNPKEEKLLADEKFQKKVANAIGASIIEFGMKYGGGELR